MSSKDAPRSRPYWHVDAKWITGLLLTVLLSLTLLVYGLVQITSEKPAVDTLTMTMALTSSRHGLDDKTEIEEVRKRLGAGSGGTFEPIPGLRLSVTEEDLANLSPRELRLSLFRQIAEPFYREGTEGLAELVEEPELEKGLAGGAGALSFFTLEMHQRLRGTFLFLGIISLLLFIPLTFFSHRFGRLAGPGCVLILASLPGAILFNLISAAPQPAAKPPVEEADMSGMLGYLAANLVPPLAEIIARTYTIALVLGLVLAISSVFGSLIWRLSRRRSSTHKPVEKSPVESTQSIVDG